MFRLFTDRWSVVIVRRIRCDTWFIACFGIFCWDMVRGWIMRGIITYGVIDIWTHGVFPFPERCWSQAFRCTSQ